MGASAGGLERAEVWAEPLAALGIGRRTRVLVYDGGKLGRAALVWLTLRQLGFRGASVVERAGVGAVGKGDVVRAFGARGQRLLDAATAVTPGPVAGDERGRGRRRKLLHLRAKARPKPLVLGPERRRTDRQRLVLDRGAPVGAAPGRRRRLSGRAAPERRPASDA